MRQYHHQPVYLGGSPLEVNPERNKEFVETITVTDHLVVEEFLPAAEMRGLTINPRTACPRLK